MSTSTIRGIKLHDLRDLGTMMNRCPEEIGAIADRYAAAGLSNDKAIKDAVILVAYASGDRVSVLTHTDDHPEMKGRNEMFSNYRTFDIGPGCDLSPILAAIDRVAVMDLRRRRMYRAGRWKTGGRYPARFWMCDTVLRGLLDRYGVTPNALQWALGNARAMTIGVEHEKIGLKPVERQGALILHCDYGVRSKTRKSLPGSLHRFRLEASEGRVTKFTLPLSDTVTFIAADDRRIEIKDELLPETLMASLVGQRAHEVVRHELLDVDDAIVTGAEREGGNTILHLTYGHAFVGDPR